MAKATIPTRETHAACEYGACKFQWRMEVRHRQIWLIFAASDRPASDLLIRGVIFVDRCLHDEDLECGSSSGA